jgi:HlyD family secretion protein
MTSTTQHPTAAGGIRDLLRGRRAQVSFAALALLVVVFLVGDWLDPIDRNGHIPMARVERGTVRITVTETGELEASHQTTVSAPTDKKIIWLAPEGTRVKQGDELVKFESRRYEIAVAAAESELAAAQARLRRSEGQLAAQQANEEKAYLNYQSLPELAEKGFITNQELEVARLAHEEVKARTRSHQAGVEAERANVGAARQVVEERDRKLKSIVLRAPRDGVVVYAHHGDSADPRKISVGMIPFDGMDLMYLPDTSKMRAETQISEHDLARVHVGSRTQLRLEAYPDAVFEGEVVRIGSLARRMVSRLTGKPLGIKVFDVTVEVEGGDERLRPGLTATVEILVSEHSEVLYVPVAAVFVDELDRVVVYRRRGGSVEARSVVLGGSTDRVAIIESGLEEGDEILLAAPEEV